MKKLIIAGLVALALITVPSVNVTLNLNNTLPGYKGAWLHVGKSCLALYNNKYNGNYELVVYKDVDKLDILFGASTEGTVMTNYNGNISL